MSETLTLIYCRMPSTISNHGKIHDRGEEVGGGWPKHPFKSGSSMRFGSPDGMSDHVSFSDPVYASEKYSGLSTSSRSCSSKHEAAVA